MRELAAGADATLLDFTASDAPEAEAAFTARALLRAVTDGTLPACDVVLSSHTILIEALPGAGLDELSVRRVARRARHDFVDVPAETFHDPVADLVVPVVYDGDDLDAAAALASTDEASLIRAHRSVLWQVQFMGFAPGFGYLVPHPSSTAADVALLGAIGRREQSRPAVPAGSVAVAAGYSAVYPRVSPGGWHLLGRTDIDMWDSSAEPPALLTAGMLVRFIGDAP